MYYEGIINFFDVLTDNINTNRCSYASGVTNLKDRLYDLDILSKVTDPLQRLGIQFLSLHGQYMNLNDKLL